MARGWESKSVEEQQSVAESSTKPESTSADRERAAQRKTLELQISQIEQQIKAARNERHRSMLEQAVAELRSRLSAL